MPDKVSIIMPVYNCRDFIEESIQSVLKQTYSNWELLIVDDCSNDNVAEVIEEYLADDRIQFFQLERNSGAAVTRNFAIEKATGRYIAFLDSDDVWHAKKLEKQIDFMRINSYVFTYTSYQQMSEEGNMLEKKIAAPKVLDYHEQLKYNHIGCLTVVYDAMYLGKVYMPLLRKRQDYALWLLILKKNEGYGMQEELAYYRLRKGSVSSNKFAMLLWNWRLYREIEQLSVLKSLYYLCYNVYDKIVNGIRVTTY